MTAKTIDEVIENLEVIIQNSKRDENPLGYFAALYKKVTISVKEKLNTNYFDDDARMEKLDVVFANKYLLAYSNYNKGKAISKSWDVAFKFSKDSNLIVLQHLLLGMNAHINLDLGVAASEISDKSNMHTLHSDFNKINAILASLVEEVQQNLSKIWPTLLKILKFFGKTDDFLIDFSMNLARDGAWKFANELVMQDDKSTKEEMLAIRDEKITGLADLVTKHRFLVRTLFKVIRFFERGNPSDKIKTLQEKL